MTRLNTLLLLALVASSVYLVRMSYEARRLTTELHRAQLEERRLDVDFERLKAERQAEATPLRVEKSAREKLAMRDATPAVTHYVDVVHPLGGLVVPVASVPGRGKRNAVNAGTRPATGRPQ